MWTHETSIVAAVPQIAAFRAWRDRVVPPGVPVVAEDPPRHFAVESSPPGVRIVFDHHVDETDDGVRLTERVTIEGPATGVYRLLFGARFVRGQAKSLGRLAAEADAFAQGLPG